MHPGNGRWSYIVTSSLIGWAHTQNDTSVLTLPPVEPAIFSSTLNTLRVRQNGCHFTDDIFKCIFLNENVWIPIKFHWNLFLRVQLTIFQYWLRWWLGAFQVTSYYLNQWLLVHRCTYAPPGFNELICWIILKKKYACIYAFYTIHWYCDGTGSWNPFSLQTREHSFHVINTAAVVYLWWHKVPGHQQLWHQPYYLRIFLSQNILSPRDFHFNCFQQIYIYVCVCTHIHIFYNFSISWWYHQLKSFLPSGIQGYI